MKSTLGRMAAPAAVFAVAAVLGSGCDYSTKAWAEEALRDAPGQSISAIAPYLDLTLRYNEGTAFSFVRDLGDARIVFGAFALAMVLVLFVVTLRTPEDRIRALALGLVAGGAIGNGLDRILRTGVVDFIRINYPWGGSWPTFNIADVLVAVGVGLLLLRGWRARVPAPA